MTRVHAVGSSRAAELVREGLGKLGHELVATESAEAVFACTDRIADVRALVNAIGRDCVLANCGPLATVEVQEAAAAAGAPVVSHPLQPGVLAEFLDPPLVIIGADEQWAARRIGAVYRQLSCHVLYTDIASADLVGPACHGFRLLNRCYFTQLTEVCQAAGVDMTSLLKGLQFDERIRIPGDNDPVDSHSVERLLAASADSSSPVLRLLDGIVRARKR